MNHPTNPKDFVGKAGIIATVLFHKVPAFKTTKLPAIDRRYLFTGSAGTGKTSLAMALASAITGNSIESIVARQATNVDWYNGQSATVDVWRKWTEHSAYLPMYGNRIVQIVDELDSISMAAANESLSYLDALPHHVVFIATTNKTVSELPERLQSRFKICRFTHVPTQAIASWLRQSFPTLKNYDQIAGLSGGNVRSALTDALFQIETDEALA